MTHVSTMIMIIIRASTHGTKVRRKAKITEFDETWLVLPIHGWDQLGRIFLSWGQPKWAGQPRPFLDLLRKWKSLTYRSKDPETKNFLYIGKDINGKFSISGLGKRFLKGS